MYTEEMLEITRRQKEEEEEDDSVTREQPNNTKNALIDGPLPLGGTQGLKRKRLPLRKKSEMPS